MPHGKTITTYLMDGTLHGPQHVQIGGGNLRLYILPREVAHKQHDCETSGLYILTGYKEGEMTSYIGQSTKCKSRMAQHYKNHSWWNTAYVIVSDKKEELDATTILYLEAKSIDDADSTSNSIICENNIKPKIPNLPNYLEPTIKQYYNEAKMLLEFAGCKVFVKAETKEEATHFIKAPNKGVEAKGIYDPSTGKVTVLADSIIEPNFAPSYKYKERRKKHMEEAGCVIKNNMPVTTKNMQFDSPSAAACFVLGRPANGLNEWKDKDGKCLNDLKK